MKEVSEVILDRACDRLAVILDEEAVKMGADEFNNLSPEDKKRAGMRVVQGTHHEHRLWMGRIATLLKDLGMKPKERIVLSEQDSEARRHALMELLRAKQCAKEMNVVCSQASALVRLMS